MRVSCLDLFIYHHRSVQRGRRSPRLLKLISVSTLWPPKVQDQKGSWPPRPLRRVVMGAEIKASGLDRNADAAEGAGGATKKRVGEGGWGVREGQRTDLSAERPIQLIPCTRAQNYLQLNDPIHRFDAPPPSLPPTDKQHKTPANLWSASPLCSITWGLRQTRMDRERGRNALKVPNTGKDAGFGAVSTFIATCHLVGGQSPPPFPIPIPAPILCDFTSVLLISRM